MRLDDKGTGIEDLIDGFLFSLKAEGRSIRTVEYYRDLHRSFVVYAHEKDWPDNSGKVDARKIREFLSWVGSRTIVHNVGNGTKRVRKAKPTTAWPYYRALRRLFNWAIQEGYLEASPIATIRFKPPSALNYRRLHS